MEEYCTKTNTHPLLTPRQVPAHTKKHLLIANIAPIKVGGVTTVGEERQRGGSELSTKTSTEVLQRYTKGRVGWVVKNSQKK